MARQIDPDSACGSQHLKLAAIIIVVVLAVCAGTIAFARSTLATVEQTQREINTAVDQRIRDVEKANEANRVRFEAIAAQLDRIERKLP